MPIEPSKTFIAAGDRVVAAPNWGFERQNGSAETVGVCLGPSKVDPAKVVVEWLDGSKFRYDPAIGKELEPAPAEAVAACLRRVIRVFTKEELLHAAQEKDRV